MRSILLVLFVIFCTLNGKGWAQAPASVFTQPSGSFPVPLSKEGGEDIQIFYYKPTAFNKNTAVIIVVPGSGRNASEYRDSWKESAEKYNLLVLSPQYPKEKYDFAAYHLGGLVNNLKMENAQLQKDGEDGERVAKYRLKDEDISFSHVKNYDAWIFGDFDKIFQYAKFSAGLKAESFDVFGHSAGGQILHRFALFNKASKVRYIVAANSGFYTLPIKNNDFPYGLKGTEYSYDQMEKAFSKKLIVLLGQKDDQNETRGTMLHTPSADLQGLGRFERGVYFYRTSEMIAKTIGVPLNWRMELVKDVGHDYKSMGQAAAALLYAK